MIMLRIQDVRILWTGHQPNGWKTHFTLISFEIKPIFALHCICTVHQANSHHLHTRGTIPQSRSLSCRMEKRNYSALSTHDAFNKNDYHHIHDSHSHWAIVYYVLYVTLVCSAFFLCCLFSRRRHHTMLYITLHQMAVKGQSSACVCVYASAFNCVIATAIAIGWPYKNNWAYN